jgi:hypothetical protein
MSIDSDSGKVLLRTLANDFLTPVFNEYDFKKRGLVWSRHVAPFLHVIDIQTSKKRDGVDLTLNIGVFSPKLWNLVWDRPEPRHIKETDCFPRMRVGVVMSDGLPAKAIDQWWRLRSESDVRQVGEELRLVLRDHCFPLLSGIGTDEDLLRIARSKVRLSLPLDKLYCAALLALSGCGGDAEALLSEMSQDEHWHDRTEAVRDRLGVADSSR